MTRQVLITLLMFLFTACTPSVSQQPLITDEVADPTLPPLVAIELADGTWEDGWQGTYCWTDGISPEICVEYEAPTFDDYHPVDAEQIQIRFATPYPKRVFFRLVSMTSGEVVAYNEAPLEVDENGYLTWNPEIFPPDDYILYVHGEWSRQGESAYAFPINPLDSSE